ncbi:MAG: ethanolamine utilization protein EutN [Epulopiscium sp. Nuni2H_MBin003]|nr:MAG: ethanolamine utilization protein EutN [Epulopiscium sp. Nuni2H_MBin003]
MEIGRVIGSVWATKKDENLRGQKLVVLKILQDKYKEKDDIVVATDIIGAGVDDLVLVSRGTGARHATGNENAPVDMAVIGIVDSIEINENVNGGNV